MDHATTSHQSSRKDDPFMNTEEEFPPLWRHHSDRINTALLRRWLPASRTDLLLKTDLFDEAISEGLHPILSFHARRLIGIDLSLPVITEARRRYTNIQAIEADVRCLPFPDAKFDVIVSNSTLDHFESFNEIIVSFHELYRILRPGGQLILTLDNLANPLILLRNKIPFSLLHHLGIVPYFVGVTLGPHRLRRYLEGIGFEIIDVDAILHSPRVLAVAMARWLEKHTSQKTQSIFLRLLTIFEHCSRLPTRFFTGNFVAIRAMKH